MEVKMVKWSIFKEGNSEYLVSSEAEVYSLTLQYGSKRPEPLLKKQQTNRGGYKYLFLGGKYWVINRLVLTVFKGSRPSSIEAAHLDGDKTNNNLSNLEWKNKLENAQDRIRHGNSGIGHKNPNSKLTEKEVIEINGLILKGREAKDIAKLFNCSRQIVSNIKLGLNWGHLNLPKIPTLFASKYVEPGKGQNTSVTLLKDANGRIIYSIPASKKRIFRYEGRIIIEGLLYYLKWEPSGRGRYNVKL